MHEIVLPETAEHAPVKYVLLVQLKKLKYTTEEFYSPLQKTTLSSICY